MINAATDSSSTDHATEVHRNAYNAAFSELGLPWHWDSKTHRQLQARARERDSVRVYLETQQSHLLKAYDADFLIDAIESTKARCFQAMCAAQA